MNIGSLYKVKKYFWLLFPTKEIAAKMANTSPTPKISIGKDLAVYCSIYYQCEVTLFEPNGYIVLLEEEGKLKKVLTSAGRIGWISLHKNFNNCVEEVSNE